MGAMSRTTAVCTTTNARHPGRACASTANETRSVEPSPSTSPVRRPRRRDAGSSATVDSLRQAVPCSRVGLGDCVIALERRGRSSTSHAATINRTAHMTAAAGRTLTRIMLRPDEASRPAMPHHPYGISVTAWGLRLPSAARSTGPTQCQTHKSIPYRRRLRRPTSRGFPP